MISSRNVETLKFTKQITKILENWNNFQIQIINLAPVSLIVIYSIRDKPKKK